MGLFRYAKIKGLENVVTQRKSPISRFVYLIEREMCYGRGPSPQITKAYAKLEMRLKKRMRFFINRKIMTKSKSGYEFYFIFCEYLDIINNNLSS